VTGWRWTRRIGLLVLTVAVVEYLAVPQLLKARSELRLFAGASPWLLVLALLLEAASLIAYTRLTQTILSAEVRIPFLEQFQIDLTGLGASHLLPGGGASAAALRYRLMTTRGVPPRDALSTAAMETATADVGLLVTFIVGVGLAMPGIVSHPAYLFSGVGGLTVLLALWLVARTTRLGLGPPTASRTSPPAHRVRRRASTWLEAARARARAAAGSVFTRSELLLHQRATRRSLVGWAGSNWLLDSASLWVCLWAYGVQVRPGALLTAYGAATLVGLLPVTPGGLGVVEGVLIPSLILLGADGGPVVLGVLTWRAIEFWLPIPVAGVAYLSLQVRQPRKARTP
jgi:uncharacterized protein (TIRG00374 family)